MPEPRTVLYVQHAGSLGGSCMSLLYLCQTLDPGRYRPVVALARPARDVEQLYAHRGIETVPWPGIELLEHTTASWTSWHRPWTWTPTARAVLGWRRSERRTLELVQVVRPDIVHLNSVVLVPSARALHREGVPFVWHVRESPVRGAVGLRFGVLRRALRAWPGEAIFLSEWEHRAWMGDGKGLVVPNSVDLSRFAPSETRAPARRALGLPEVGPVVLFLGQPDPMKGSHVLLRAVARIRAEFPRLVCLMAGSVYTPSRALVPRIARAVLPAVGWGTDLQRLDRLVDHLGVGDACVRKAFDPDTPRLLAASDLLVFPALRDHFARPVLEAGAAGLPVVGSRLPTLEEQVVDGRTGYLVPPGDDAALASAIARVLRDPALARRMGEAGRALAVERHDSARNTLAIMSLYDRVLGLPLVSASA